MPPSPSKPKTPIIPPTLKAQLALKTRSLPREPSIADRYRFRPEAFLQEQLGVELYEGFSLDWVRDIATGWLHAHAREAYGRGKDPVEACLSVRPDLVPWEPGMPVVNTFVLQGGSGLGKSVVLSGVLLWAAVVSESFVGAVYAPFVDLAYRNCWRYLDAFMSGSWEGANTALLSPLLRFRKGKEGDPSLEVSSLKSVSTKATNQGAARVQGQHAIVGSGDRSHASVHLFDEADKIDDPEVFNSVKTLVDKGVSLWLISLNPMTATAPVQDLRGPSVRRYELSVLDHPNVQQGRDVIPGASNREWVEQKLGDWAEEVSEHDPRAGTFELDWLPGRVFKPLPPWWWRVVGVVPPTGGGDSAVSEALYLTACSRDAATLFRESDPIRGTLGVDVAQSDAGHGDSGAIARLWRGCLQVVGVHQKDSRVYGFRLVERLNEMADGGCREVEVRIDAGGGFGRDVYNQIADHDVGGRFASYRVVLRDFGGKSPDERRYKNWITYAYCSVEAVLGYAAVVDPPKELRVDLCARKLRWGDAIVNGGKVDVVYLEPKKSFREDRGRSPDDGDAVALACAPWSGPVGGFEAYDGRAWGADRSARAPEEEGQQTRGSARGAATTTDDLLLGRAPGEDPYGGGRDPFETALRWSR